jgi:hypothetical protein
MRQIKFIAEDFKTLDIATESIFNERSPFEKAYVNNVDCPLARAFKRVLGHDNISVSTISVRVNNKFYYFQKCFGFDEVVEMAERVSKNGIAIFRFGCQLKII